MVFGHVRSRRIKQMKAFDFLEVWQKSLGVDGLLLLLAAAARGSLAARCPLFATFPGGGRCAACSFAARWCLSPQHARWVPLLLPACCSLSPAAVAGSLRAARCLLAAAHCRCSPRCYLPLPLAAAKNPPCHERGSGTEVWHDVCMRFLGVHTGVW